jgi:NACalpha-BTF3-like transcription factor
MASRKKNFGSQEDIPGNEVSVLPTNQVKSFLPVVASQGSFLPANGLVIDNNAAVSYIASVRRKQLREAKDKCEKTRKSINASVEALKEEQFKLITAQAKNEEEDWTKALNTTFAKTKTALRATVLVSKNATLDEDKQFSYERKLVNASLVDAEKDRDDNSYYGRVWSETRLQKASGDVLKVVGKIKRLDDTLNDVSDIEIKIQRAINELQYSAMETQAALFAQTMKAEPTGQGQDILDTLDAKLASMDPIPIVPELPV